MRLIDEVRIVSDRRNVTKFHIILLERVSEGDRQREKDWEKEHADESYRNKKRWAWLWS